MSVGWVRLQIGTDHISDLTARDFVRDTRPKGVLLRSLQTGGNRECIVDSQGIGARKI